MRVANVKLPGEFKGFTRVSLSFMVYTTASTLSTNSLQWSLELPPWREGGGMVTGVAALEGGRRDAGVTLCGYSPRKFSPTNSVQQ